MKKKKNPTLREIAQKSGYSVTAVSFALRDSPQIASKTRLKIQKIAQKLGWTPNPMVSAWMSHLRSTKSISYQGNLAFLYNRKIPFKQADLGIQQFYQGAIQYASQFGYQVELISTQEPLVSGERLTKILKSRGIQGLIIGGFAPSNLSSIDWSQFSCATAGYSIQQPRFHRVCTDLRKAFRKLLSQSLQLGYQKIGSIIPDSLDQICENSHLDVFCHEIEKKSSSIKIPPFHSHEPSESNYKNLLKKWIQKYQPDLIVGSLNKQLNQLKEIGLQIPKKVGFVTLNCTSDSHQVSGIAQSHAHSGALTAELVIDQLNRNERGIPSTPKTILHEEFSWFNGKTTTKNSRN